MVVDYFRNSDLHVYYVAGGLQTCTSHQCQGCSCYACYEEESNTWIYFHCYMVCFIVSYSLENSFCCNFKPTRQRWDIHGAVGKVCSILVMVTSEGYKTEEWYYARTCRQLQRLHAYMHCRSLCFPVISTKSKSVLFFMLYFC